MENSLLNTLEIGDFATAMPLIDNIGSKTSSALTLPDDRTPLHYACQHGRIDIAKKFIADYKYSIESKDARGCTPLYIAAKFGQTRLLKYLTEMSSCPDSDNKLEHENIKEEFLKKHSDFVGNTLLHVASLHGHLDAVFFLTHDVGINPNMKNMKEQTCFALAAEYCLTLQDNVTKDFPLDGKSSLPLLYLAVKEGHVEFLKFVIDTKRAYSLSKRRSSRQLLLCTAIKHGQLSVLQYLVAKHNCDPCSVDDRGSSFLHLASAQGHLDIVKYLIDQHKISPQLMDNCKVTPLHDAALHGHVKVVKYFIEDMQCEKNPKDNTGRVPLHFASYNGNLHVIKYLVETCNCDPLLQDNNKAFPLHLAGSNGQVDVVKYFTTLLKGKINFSNEMLVHPAAANGHLEVAKFYIEDMKCGATMKDEQGKTPLHLASQNDHVDLVKYLMLCCDPFSQDKDEFTSLHLAASNGHLEIVRLLLEYGINYTNHVGRTPLHLASLNGHLETVKCIVAAPECDPVCEDQDQYTPLQLAALNGHLEVVKYFMTDLCPTSGMHVFSGSPLPSFYKPSSPWHLAASNGHLNVVKFFVHNMSCDISSTDDLGRTPLHLASHSGHLNVVKYISAIIPQSDLVCQDQNQSTPLHLASSGGYLEVVKFLTENGKYNLMFRDKDQKSPLHLAAANGHLEILHHFAIKFKEESSLLMKDGSPLHYAAYNGHLEVVKFFSEAMKCDPTISDNFGKTSLHYASQNGHSNIVKYLTDFCHCDPVRRDNNKMSPLCLAVATGQLEIIKYYMTKITKLDSAALLCSAVSSGHIGVVKFFIEDMKCDTHFTDDLGRSLLHLASEHGHLEVVKYLANTPLYRDSNQSTPLHLAAACGQLEVVKYFTKILKVDPLILDKHKSTPLHNAASAGHLEVVKFFTEDLKCNVNSINDLGRNPLHLASLNGHLEVVQHLMAMPLCDFKCKDQNQYSPLHLAAFNGHLEVVKFQCDNVPLPLFGQYCDQSNCDLVHLAVTSGHSEVVQYLMCSPSQLINKQALLKYASSCAQKNVLEVLLIHGVRDFGGLACQEAYKIKRVDLVQLILSYHTQTDNDLMQLNWDDMRLHLCKGEWFNFEADFARSSMPHDSLPSDSIGSVRLANNQLSKLPIELFQLPNVREVNVANNKITKLPTSVSGQRSEHYGWACLNLEILDFSGNELTFSSSDQDGATKVLFKLPKLAHINLSSNRLSKLPDNLWECTSLQILNVSNNKLSTLPLCEPDQANPQLLHKSKATSSLVQLDLSKNNFITFPRNLDCFAHQLKELNLTKNPLKKVETHFLSTMASQDRENLVLSLAKNFNFDVNSRDNQGRTLLHHACRWGNLSLIQMLIQKHKVDIEALNNHNDPPIHVAALSGNKEAVLVLIEKFGCDHNVKGHLGRSLLHSASIGGNYDLVHTLLFRYLQDINTLDDQSNTPLHVAALNGQMEIVMSIISLGEEVKGYNGRSLLHSACIGGNISLIKALLLDYYECLKTVDDKNNPPIHVAALNGKLEVVLMLLNYESGQSSIKGCLGKSLLHSACIGGNYSLVKKLIYRMDTKVLDDNNNTPLHDAALSGNEEITLALINEFGFQSEVTGHRGQSLLHSACIGGNVSLIRSLLLDYYNQDINATDDRNNTPLHVAALNGKTEVVLALVDEFNCDPLSKGYLGRSLLHSACIGNNVSLIQILIEKYKLSLCANDEENNTPLHVAALFGKEETILTLINKFHCDPDVRGHRGQSLLHLACAGGNVNTVRSICKFIPHLVVDSSGDTPLHTCAAKGFSSCVEALLHHGAPVLIRNNAGKTPRDVAIGEAKVLLDEHIRINKKKIYKDYELIQKKAKEKYSGAERITRIFVIGNPGAGKSSLIEALKREKIYDFRNISELSVPRHTAGIIPSVYTSKHYGRVMFYDFAGDPEYYSSHAAILENLVSSKKGDNIFIIVVDLREDNESIRNTVSYWTMFIKNQNFMEKNSFFLIAGSHLDTLKKAQKNEKFSEFNKICEPLNIPYVMLNCCQPKSNPLKEVKDKIVSLTKGSPCYKLSLQASLLLGLIEKDFESVISCSIQTLISHIELTGIGLPVEDKHLNTILSELQDIGILFKVTGEDDTFVMLDITKLTKEVHKLLFSKQASTTLNSGSSAFNIGIIPQELLFSRENGSKKAILPDYITKECLVQLQYCQEISHRDIDAFLSPNADIMEQPSMDQSFLFFPALCTAQKSEVSWNSKLEVNYSIGWLAQCALSEHYFPQRFLHVMLLRMVFKFTLTAPQTVVSTNHSIFNRRCTMWTTGVHWLMEEGVECMVELVNASKAVVVTVQGREGAETNFTDVFVRIIDCVTTCIKDFCHNVKYDAFFLDSTNEIDYFNKDNMFAKSDLDKILASPEKISVVSISGKVTSSRLPRIYKQIATQNFGDYVSSLPSDVYPQLEYQLDWDNEVDRDLREIAHHMLGWDLKLATYLKLTEVDISDIKGEHAAKPELQRCVIWS